MTENLAFTICFVALCAMIVVCVWIFESKDND